MLYGAVAAKADGIPRRGVGLDQAGEGIVLRRAVRGQKLPVAAHRNGLICAAADGGHVAPAAERLVLLKAGRAHRAVLEQRNGVVVRTGDGGDMAPIGNIALALAVAPGSNHRAVRPQADGMVRARVDGDDPAPIGNAALPLVISSGREHRAIRSQRNGMIKADAKHMRRQCLAHRAERLHRLQRFRGVALCERQRQRRVVHTGQFDGERFGMRNGVLIVPKVGKQAEGHVPFPRVQQAERLLVAAVVIPLHRIAVAGERVKQRRSIGKAPLPIHILGRAVAAFQDARMAVAVIAERLKESLRPLVVAAVQHCGRNAVPALEQQRIPFIRFVERFEQRNRPRVVARLHGALRPRSDPSAACKEQRQSNGGQHQRDTGGDDDRALDKSLFRLRLCGGRLHFLFHNALPQIFINRVPHIARIHAAARRNHKIYVIDFVVLDVRPHRGAAH